MIILRQKEYARRDYEGLTEEYAAKLRKQRSELADSLLKERARINRSYEENLRFNKEDFGNKPEKLAAFNKKSLENRNKAYQRAITDSRHSALKRRKGILEDQNLELGNSPNTTQTSKMGEGWLKRNWNKLGTGGKVAVIGVPVAAAAIGTGMAIRNKTKNES